MVSRSENMRRIRSKNSKPELTVRMALRAQGHIGYRLHRKEVPGNPDIVFLGAKRAIFVNGCFWHGHNCKVGLRRPRTNQDYWIPKIRRTQERDCRNLTALVEQGWKVLVVWECEIKDHVTLSKKLSDFMLN